MKLKRLTERLEADPLPVSVIEQQLLLAESMRDQPAAIAALQAAEAIENRSAMLDLARVKLMTQLSAQATGSQKSHWLAQAAQTTRKIEQQHGNYWGRRAELILIDNQNATEAATTSATQLDLLTRLAAQALRQQRFADAAKAYTNAARTARQLGETEKAFALDVRSAQALEPLKQHQQAAEQLTTLARQYPQNQLASAAHLRGCWNWKKITTDDPERKKILLELLAEHVTTWPQAASANQARYWLGKQWQAEKKWQSAFDTYIAVAPASPHFAQAFQQSIDCAKQHLRTLPSPRQQQAFSQHVLTELEEIQQQPPPTSATQLQVILARIEISIRYSQADPSIWLASLRQAVDRCDAPNLKITGQAWLLAIEAFNPQSSPTIQTLLDSVKTYPTELKIVEQAIVDISQRHPNLITAESQAIHRSVIEAALQLSLSQQELTVWRSRKATLLIATGDHAQALTVLDELEKSQPRDRTIQLQIARLLTQIHQTQSPDIPLKRWRRLATQLKPHTESWYEAKYHVALMLEKSGRSDDAQKLLEYIQVIPPGWNDSSFKTKFEQLLARCKSR